MPSKTLDNCDWVMSSSITRAPTASPEVRRHPFPAAEPPRRLDIKQTVTKQRLRWAECPQKHDLRSVVHSEMAWAPSLQKVQPRATASGHMADHQIPHVISFWVINGSCSGYGWSRASMSQPGFKVCVQITPSGSVHLANR